MFLLCDNSAYSIAWMRLGFTEEAFQQFNKSFDRM